MRRTILALLGALVLITTTAFGDIVVGSGGAGWQNWVDGDIDQNGTPFWDGDSSDSGGLLTIGNCLAGTGACVGQLPSPPGAIPYWGIGTAADPNYYFHDGIDPTVSLLLEIAGNANSNSFGWYDVNNPANRGTIFTGPATAPITIVVAIPIHNYGFWLSGPDGTFYTQSNLNPSGDKIFQHFATFKDDGTLPGPTYWIGIEDLQGYHSDKDYNDMIVSVTPIPEPGTIGIFGAGLLLSGYWIRRRRK